VFSDIADADLREAPERVTAAFLARSLFCSGRRGEARYDGGSKRSSSRSSYAELVDNDDKVLSRQIAGIMFSGILCKARRLYEFGALTTAPNTTL